MTSNTSCHTIDNYWYIFKFHYTQVCIKKQRLYYIKVKMN